jgi:hypothetical protein
MQPKSKLAQCLRAKNQGYCNGCHERCMENDQRKLLLEQRFKTSKVTPIAGTNMTCDDCLLVVTHQEEGGYIAE